MAFDHCEIVTLVCWENVTLGHWESVTLGHWESVKLVHWESVTLGHGDNVTLGYCDNVTLKCFFIMHPDQPSKARLGCVHFIFWHIQICTRFLQGELFKVTMYTSHISSN